MYYDKPSEIWIYLQLLHNNVHITLFIYVLQLITFIFQIFLPHGYILFNLLILQTLGRNIIQPKYIENMKMTVKLFP